MGDTLQLIKESFEEWYNENVDHNSKATIVVNYSDERTLVIKAYHKVNIRMCVVKIMNGMSYTYPLFDISENYNHGVTTEEEAKESITKKFLLKVFTYCRNIK